jgi:hypothetical protein
MELNFNTERGKRLAIEAIIVGILTVFVGVIVKSIIH